MGDNPPFKPILIHNTGKGLVPGDEDPHWRITAGPKMRRLRRAAVRRRGEADGRYLANDRDTLAMDLRVESRAAGRARRARNSRSRRRSI